MSWPWPARTNTRWRRSSSPSTHTPRCRKPSPKRPSTPSAERYTCDRSPVREGPPRHRTRRPGRGRRARRRVHPRHAARGARPSAGRAAPLRRRRLGHLARAPGRPVRRRRHRRVLRVATQQGAREHLATRRDLRARGVRRDHPRVPGDPPLALPRLSRPGRAAAHEPGPRRRGERVVRARKRRMSARVLQVVRADVVPYAEALAWQRALAQARLEGRLPHDVLLLLEHPPVLTLGRTARETHLLRREGIDVFEVERGGDVTYHGPGQLVGYPILDLAGYRKDLHWYLRTLEQALIDALTELGVAGARNPGHTGVWIRREQGNRKIASIGVHVKQWVTWHGFALNVTTDLAQFDRIVACGIRGVEMTTVERETLKDSLTVAGPGKRETLWDETVAAVVRGFEGAFGVTARFVEENRLGEASRECVQERR